MLFPYTVIGIIVTAIALMASRHQHVNAQSPDKCWNRIKISCGGERKRTPFPENMAPEVSLSDVARIDSSGVITEELLLSDTVSLTIKKYTVWGTNVAANRLERKVQAIDSIVEKIRWECEYVGPGKGNCSSCQATDCNGRPVGPLKSTAH